MNKVLIGVLVLVLLGGGALFVMNSQKQTSDDQMVKEEVVISPTEVTQKVDANEDDTAVAEKGAVKTFEVTGEPFSFSLKEMKVKQGDTVKVIFSNKEGIHNWVLDEFDGAKTKTIAAGESETVQFVADKKGTFEYYCSVGAHRANGMKGNFIVE